MQADFGIIFLATATKHIFRHPPIRSLNKYRNIRNSSIHHHLKLTMIKIGFSIPIWPPQTRLVYTQLWKIAFVKLHLFSSMGIHV